jgi:hypothetical protein
MMKNKFYIYLITYRGMEENKEVEDNSQYYTIDDFTETPEEKSIKKYIKKIKKKCKCMNGNLGTCICSYVICNLLIAAVVFIIINNT